MHKTVIFLVFLTLWVVGCDNTTSNTEELLINKWVLSAYNLNDFLTKGRGKTWSPQQQKDLDSYMQMALGKMYFELQTNSIYQSTPAPNVIVEGQWTFDAEKKELSMKANQMTEGASKTTIYTIQNITKDSLQVISDENMLLTFKAVQ